MRERGSSTPRAGERRVHEQLARLFAPADDDAVPALSPAPALAPAPASALGDDRGVKQIIAANVTVEPMEV